jgi:hypothetical protein
MNLDHQSTVVSGVEALEAALFREHHHRRPASILVEIVIGLTAMRSRAQRSTGKRIVANEQRLSFAKILLLLN